MIKLNDLLHLTDEQASKAKVKFNRDNGYDDPIDIYKSNPDLIKIKLFQQPICHIHNLHALVLVHFLPCAGDDHLRIGVCDFKQR